jgi:hypothetical protein
MRGRSRYRIQTLVQTGTGTSLALPWFSRRPIVDACRARGWRFGASGSRSSWPTPPTPAPTPAEDPECPPDPAQLPALIVEGLRMVREREQRSDLDIHRSIERQLEFLQDTIDRGEHPAADKIASLTLGVYAAREFETSDPEFADVLFAVNYLANRL